MKALAWYVSHWVHRLGRVGCAACLLLAAGAALYWGVTVPGLARLEAARTASDLTHARDLQTRRAAAGNGDGARLAALLAPLPPSGNEAVNAVLAALWAQADGGRVVLGNSTYQLGTDGSGTVERYVITLPLKGRYVDVRDFLARVHGAAPHLALDTLVLARPAKEDATVEAQLQFTAYFRRRP